MEWNEFNKTLAVYCLSLHEPNSPIIPILKALIEVCERNQTLEEELEAQTQILQQYVDHQAATIFQLREELEAMNKELEELRAKIIPLQEVWEIHPPLGSDKPVE